MKMDYQYEWNASIYEIIITTGDNLSWVSREEYVGIESTKIYGVVFPRKNIPLNSL